MKTTKTTKTTKPALGDQKIFPLADAQLAVDIHALRTQLALLCDRARSNPRCEAVCGHLVDAASDVADALLAALVIDKP